MMPLADEIHDFWFDGDEPCLRKVWFERSEDFDREIRDRFLTDYSRAAAGEHNDLARTARGALALIIMLDQFPRNLFRDDARAFATDDKALEIAQKAVVRKYDATLNWTERMFLYMPFQHAEDLALQERSVMLFSGLGNEASAQSAMKHRDIVKRFGRFPHRNVDLGRVSTANEEEFLAEHGRGF